MFRSILSCILVYQLWFSSLAQALTNEEQAPFIFSYRAMVGDNTESTLASIETINTAVEEKFDTNSVDFKKSHLGALYAGSLKSVKMAKNFKACQEIYPEFVTQKKEVHAGGRSQAKRTVYERPEYDIKDYQDRLLQVSLSERFTKADESENCNDPIPAGLDASSNVEDLLKATDQVSAKYNHPLENSHEVKLQKALIAENLRTSLYSYMHFMRQFGSNEKDQLNTNGDIPEQVVLEKFCGGSTALTTKTVDGEVHSTYGSSMGGAVYTSQKIVPDQIIARCNDEQVSELKKEFALAQARLSKENISKVNLDKTKTFLNEKMQLLNQQIELANDPKKDPEYLARQAEHIKARNRNGPGSAEKKHIQQIRNKAKAQYEAIYAEILVSPSGVLLQSDYLKDKYQKGGIGSKRSFSRGKMPLHLPINELRSLENAVSDGKIKIAAQAVSMYDSLNKLEFDKTKLSNEEFLQKRVNDLKDLFQANPRSVAKVLNQESNLSRVACLATVEIAKEMESNAYWDKIYMGAGFIVGGGLILTGVGSGLGAATIAGTAVSLGVTAAGAVHDHQVEAEALKDAENVEKGIFAGSGDEYSADDLKQMQEEARTRLNGWRTAAVLAPLDFIGLGQSFKVAKNLSSFNGFTKSLEEANLVSKAKLLRESKRGLFGDGKFGVFLGDLGEADEATKLRFKEKLASWDGNPSSVDLHFADFKPELAKIGGAGATEYKEIEKILGPLDGNSREKYVELLNDPDKLKKFLTATTKPDELSEMKAPEVGDISDYNDVRFIDRGANDAHPKNINGQKINEDFLENEPNLTGNEDFAIGFSQKNGPVFNLADRLAGEMNRPVLTFMHWNLPNVKELFPPTLNGQRSKDLESLRGFLQGLKKNAQGANDRKLFHVNLDDGNSFEAIFKSQPGDYHTSSEVYAIFSDPELLKRTNFYENGKMLRAEELQKRLAPYKNKIEELRFKYPVIEDGGVTEAAYKKGKELAGDKTKIALAKKYMAEAEKESDAVLVLLDKTTDPAKVELLSILAGKIGAKNQYYAELLEYADEATAMASGKPGPIEFWRARRGGVKPIIEAAQSTADDAARASFPRAPKEFIESLDQFQSIPGTKNPFTSEESRSLSSALDADMAKAAEVDGFAKGSVPHMQEHDMLATQYAEYYKQLGIDPEYYRLLAKSHDMGKFIPDEEVLALAKKWSEGNPGKEFLLGRISWHDQSTIAYLIKKGNELKIPKEKIDHLISDIIGHNDGSGDEVAGIFWKDVGWSEAAMGKYPRPRRLEGDILAFNDRFGQGSSTGAMKIFSSIKGQKSLQDAATEAYQNNPQNTMRQLESIGQNIEGTRGVKGFTQSELYLNAKRAQQKTVEAFKKIKWEEGEAVITKADGTTLRAKNADEFSSAEFQQALFAENPTTSSVTDLGDYNKVSNIEADVRLIPQTNKKGQLLNAKYVSKQKVLDGSEDYAIGVADNNGLVYNFANRLAGETSRPVLTNADINNPSVSQLLPSEVTFNGRKDPGHIKKFFQNFALKANRQGDRKLFHVNLDGGNSIEKVFAAKAGSSQTASEVLALLSDPQLLARTNFYEKGKLLSAEEVSARLEPFRQRIQELQSTP